jgi:hypothetical protein
MLRRTVTLLFPSLPYPICRALTLSVGLFLFHVNNTLWNIKVKVKQSHYRPGQALRVPGG